MRSRNPLLFCCLLGITAIANVDYAPHRGLPEVLPNPNIDRAGVLRDHRLRVALEAQASTWRLDGPSRPSMTIAAFSEVGRPPLLPGPLVRVQQGTEIRFSIHNALQQSLTFLVPAALRGGPTGRRAVDSVLVLPDATDSLTITATRAGSYSYRAVPPRVTGGPRLGAVEGLLAGAIVVDSVGAAPVPGERVFVIMASPDSVLEAEASQHIVNLNKPDKGRVIFTINGRSWPNTERITATVGDSLHWRVINASPDFHPMHLHGFYYRVNAFSDPRIDPRLDARDAAAPPGLVVTQLLPPWATMSMSWWADRPGNWIFHCHFALHLMPDTVSATSQELGRRGMVGLVLGVSVADRLGSHSPGALAPRRRLRLIAIADSGAPGETGGPIAPSTHFVLEEQGRRTVARQGFSPEIDLVRGEPVSITVVNQMSEPTSVHWHGIELEDSYVDGVPGVSGAGHRLAPVIAPGDSFEARFTPPRAGTFMYHAHVDEVSQQRDGLLGALIVRERGVAHSPDDHVLFLKGSRRIPDSRIGDATVPLEINGQSDPDTIVLHVGRVARFRLLSLATANPEPTASLSARPDSAYELESDTMLVRWRLVAKDGAELSGQPLREARQSITMGETYDFEFTPARAGSLRFEFRNPPGFGGVLLERVPVRVE